MNLLIFLYTFFLCCLPLSLSNTTVSKSVFSKSVNLSGQTVVAMFTELVSSGL